MTPSSLAGATAGAATFGGYMIGADRAYWYDAAVTMDRFVAVPFGDVIGTQEVWNNHPVFSLISHGVWRVFGGGEVAMRVAPALFAAVAVGLMVWRVGVRRSVWAGLAAGLVLATHPLIAVHRDVRGYTLAVLAIVVMGIAVLDVDKRWLFAVALGVGAGTHLYATVPAAALVAYRYRDRGFDRGWMTATMWGLVLGAIPYMWMLDELGREHWVRVWRPTFAFRTSEALLGGVLVSAVCLAVVLFRSARRITDPAIVAVGVMALGVVGPWLVGVEDLYPRFAYFVVPSLALAVGIGADRSWLHLGLVGLAAVAMVARVAPWWAEDGLPNRQVAQMVSGDVCGLGWPTHSMQWYEPGLRLDRDCPVAVVLLPDVEPQDEADWPVVCWEHWSARIIAHTPADCDAQVAST